MKVKQKSLVIRPPSSATAWICWPPGGRCSLPPEPQASSASILCLAESEWMSLPASLLSFGEALSSECQRGCGLPRRASPFSPFPPRKPRNANNLKNRQQHGILFWYERLSDLHTYTLKVILRITKETPSSCFWNSRSLAALPSAAAGASSPRCSSCMWKSGRK